LIFVINLIALPLRHAPQILVQKVVQAPMPLIVRASGTLEAKQSVTIRAQFDGPVQNKQFREGQKVKAGELLAIIGRERIRIEFEGKKDALTNAQSDLSHARSELRLQKALFRKQAVARSAVDDAQRALVKAEQALRNAQESFKLEMQVWNSSSVTAPFDGTVVKDSVGDDKFISASKDIATIADVSEYTVRAKVDELDIKQVHEGQRATIHIQIYPQNVFAAKVTQVGSAPDGQGPPEIPIVLRLESTQGLLLRPRLSAEAHVLTGLTEPVVSVPLTAISNTDGAPKVWTLGFFNRLRPVAVALGRSNPERVEVTQGLRPGQAVCQNADPSFENGTQVRVVSPKKGGPHG
jgi:RND family efflux transporter MFP subunit